MVFATKICRFCASSVRLNFLPEAQFHLNFQCTYKYLDYGTVPYIAIVASLSANFIKLS